MATQSDDKRVKDIVGELQGATLGGHALLAVLPKLRRLLEADKVAAYKPVRTGAGFKIEFAFFEGLPAGAEKQMQDWARAAPANAFLFDPEAPEADQRNKVVRPSTLLPADQLAKVPIVRELFAKLGLSGLDQIRVLVCDEGRLLSWVGAFRARPFTAEDEQRFALLVPALQSRLQLEASLYK